MDSDVELPVDSSHRHDIDNSMEDAKEDSDLDVVGCEQCVMENTDVPNSTEEDMCTASRQRGNFPIRVRNMAGEERCVWDLQQSSRVSTLCNKISTLYQIPIFAVRLLHEGAIYTS